MQLKNKNIVHTLLVAFLSLLTYFSFAQGTQPGVFKYITLVNVADSTTVSPVNCRIYYNEQSHKPRIYFNNAWHNLVGGGSSFSLSNGNGTTAVGSAVNLGGTITSNVAITDNGTHTFEIGTSANPLSIFRATALSGFNQLSVTSTSTQIGMSSSINLFTELTNGGHLLRTSSTQFISLYNNGGTGITIQQSATKVISLRSVGLSLTLGSDATGDTWYRNSSGLFTRIPAGAQGTFFSMGASSVPSWSTLTIPSTISANSIFVSNSANTLVELTPTGGQSIRRNAGNTSWEAFTPGGGGITNTAANTELMMSDATNAVPSGLFVPSLGNVTFGSGSISGSRNIILESSSTNSSLVLQTKAGGIFQVVSSNAPTLGIVIDPNASTFYCANAATFNIRGTTSGTNGQDLNIEGGTGTGGTGGRLILRGGLSGVSEANYGNVILSSPIVEIGVFNHVASTSTTIRGIGGNNSAVNGIDLVFQGGAGYTVSGNGNGGDVTIRSGLRRTTGAGVDGDVIIDALTGSLKLTQTPPTDNTLGNILVIDNSTGGTVKTRTAASLGAIDSNTSSTSGGTITLNLNSQVQRLFVGSASFSTAKIIALSNATNALVFDFHFEITNVAAVLTMPSDFLMSDVNWDGTDWTPPSTGKYEMAGSFDGTNWKVKIAGAYN